jgi:hypothetical protein
VQAGPGGFGSGLTGDPAPPLSARGTVQRRVIVILPGHAE